MSTGTYTEMISFSLLWVEEAISWRFHRWCLTCKFMKLAKDKNWLCIPMETSIVERSSQALRILIGSLDNLFWLAVENGNNTNYAYYKSSLWGTCGEDQRMRIWKTKQNQQISELASSSEFYFLKNHLKSWCIYTNDASIEENILETAHLKLPSEPVFKATQEIY